MGNIYEVSKGLEDGKQRSGDLVPKRVGEQSGSLLIEYAKEAPVLDRA